MLLLHKTPCFEPKIFEEKFYLPLPTLYSSKEHYSLFSDIYTNNTQMRRIVPSLKPAKDADAAEADKKHKALFVSGKVRNVVHCQECFKP